MKMGCVCIGCIMGGARKNDFYERDLNLHIEGSIRDLCNVTRDGIIGYTASYSDNLELIGPPIYQKKGKRWGLIPNIGATGAKHSLTFIQLQPSRTSLCYLSR
jgi:hypothetical protein